IVLMVSSNLKPYQEALAGFQQQYGRKVPTFFLSDGEPTLKDDTRVIVAIGGKAALHEYPDNVRLIYCLAPGLTVGNENYSEAPIKIHTAPNLFLTVSKFKEIQP